MQLVAGQDIGPYRLVEEAGSGGMAVVWRAFHSRLERYVAIKFLSPQYASDPEYLSRFEREARAISRLEHPNILTVYDYGEVEAWTYMVSPFVGGGTLAARMKRGPWVLDEAITILEPLADALDYAHGEGIVHRDIKPSNVLFSERGRLVLSDFGIARILEASTLLSHAGLIIGTPMYMSPEQAEGQPSGPSSDLYSLGIVAYEMLTGRPPFTAETPLALLRAHIDKPLPPLRSFNPRVPEAVEAALFKLLAKAPVDRYKSGIDFISALRSASATRRSTRSTQIRGGASAPPDDMSKTNVAARQAEGLSASLTNPSPSRSQGLSQGRAVGLMAAILVLGAVVAVIGLAIGNIVNFDPLVNSERGSGGGQSHSATATPITLQLEARCTDAALRFPELNLSDARASVAAAYRSNGVDVDLARPGTARLTPDQAEQVLGGWMAISLLMERSGQPPPTLADWLNSETDRPTLAKAILAGRRLDRMVTADEWATMRGWTATTCEGAFLSDPRNSAALNLMERVVATGTSPRPVAAIPPVTVTATSTPQRTDAPSTVPVRCVDATVRFPESIDSEAAVQVAFQEYMARGGVTVDPARTQFAGLAEAYAERHAEVLAGWMAVTLQYERRGLPTFPLVDFVASDIIVATGPGAYQFRATISPQGWTELGALPGDTCEGAFLKHPENARWVEAMKSSVGDISWALRSPAAVPGATMTIGPTASATTRTISAAILGRTLFVKGTGGAGARLRAEPGEDGTILTVVPEYTPLVVIGQDRLVKGVTWRHLRAPDGTEGWIAAPFVFSESE